MRKKALIITYYWPPSGGSAVQRWVKFVKYLKDFNWEPVVYTPSNPHYPVMDSSFTNDIPGDIIILRNKIWEPYKLFKWFTGRGKNENLITGFTYETKKSRFRDAISNWLRSNFFIPDARKFWIRPSVKYLTRYLLENPADVLITTGPPHSMHLIGLGIKKQLNIKWVADFRDPWTKIDFYSELLLTKYADKKHHTLEKAVIKQADQIIVVSETMKKDFINSGGKNIVVIPNGFDEDDFPDDPVETDQKFSIVYTGVLNQARNPKSLWEVFAEVISENKYFAKSLEIKLIGNIDHSILKNLDEYKLSDFVQKFDFLPHDRVIQYQRKAQVLLLPINNTPNAKGIITGKIFEYLAARRPILAIGPTDGDVADILAETQAGVISDFNDTVILKKNILHYYDQFLKKNLEIPTAFLDKYSRRELSKKLGQILNQTT
ncbi:MAG: glycosyl transferase family 1 [Bacteroides sp. SM23_62_1]|nr:MAG: glycosyl transferase family 1 [Bacteroides sp. SM23_62_1]